MLGLYPVADVRAAEEEVMATVPVGTLMQRASFGLAVECTRLLREIVGAVSGARVAILVGSGNNGGDALFAGAVLQARGVQVCAYTVGERWHEAGARALLDNGGRIEPFADSLPDVELILDAVVGIGAVGPLREPGRSAIQQANASDALRVAVDVPSGVDADDGSVLGDAAFCADVTVTFGCAKPGLFQAPGADFAGAVRLVDIGLDQVLPRPMWQVVGLTDALEYLHGPSRHAYKYSRGVVGVAAGSARYPGAARLAVAGARFTGVGMTTILDRDDDVAQDTVREFPDVVTTRDDPRMVDRISAWVCGPGFVGDEADADLIGVLLQLPVPVVLDAGALSAVARDAHLRTAIEERGQRGRVTVLTPHAGEYRALFGDDEGSAASKIGAITVRKGPATCICLPDGTGFIDTAGTADLACAGSGDVLAGIIAGLLAHYADVAGSLDRAGEIVATAVWLHGMAGRCASVADRPVLATDLMRVLPEVISGVRRGEVSW